MRFHPSRRLLVALAAAYAVSLLLYSGAWTYSVSPSRHGADRHECEYHYILDKVDQPRPEYPFQHDLAQHVSQASGHAHA